MTVPTGTERIWKRKSTQSFPASANRTLRALVSINSFNLSLESKFVILIRLITAASLIPNPSGKSHIKAYIQRINRAKTESGVFCHSFHVDKITICDNYKCSNYIIYNLSSNCGNYSSDRSCVIKEIWYSFPSFRPNKCHFNKIILSQNKCHIKFNTKLV